MHSVYVLMKYVAVAENFKALQQNPIFQYSMAPCFTSTVLYHTVQLFT